MISEDKVTTQNAFISHDGKPFDWTAYLSASKKKGWRQMGTNKFGTLFIKRIPKKYYGGTAGMDMVSR